MKFYKGQLFRGKIPEYNIDEIIQIDKDTIDYIDALSIMNLNEDNGRGSGERWGLGINREDEYFTIEKITPENNPEYFL